MEQKPKKLLDQVSDRLRVKHYSIRTEQACVNWIKRYISGTQGTIQPTESAQFLPRSVWATLPFVLPPLTATARKNNPTPS